MPVWLLVVLLCAATYRLTRLIVRDDFPPVLWLRDRLVGGWRPLTDKEHAAYLTAPRDRIGDVLPLKLKADAPAWMKHVQSVDYEDPRGTQESRFIVRWTWVPYWLSDLLSCPWCASGWVSLALVVAVAFTVGVPAPLLVWPAVWGAGALLAARKWS